MTFSKSKEHSDLRVKHWDLRVKHSAFSKIKIFLRVKHSDLGVKHNDFRVSIVI